MDPTGELRFIEEMIGKKLNGDLLVGVGDDCAVIAWGANRFMLVSTDILIENVHFLREYGGFRAAGEKAVAVNVSDIAAMGGRPLFLFVSGSVPDEDSLRELAHGLRSGAERYGCIIAGGDTSRSDTGVVNITVIGETRGYFPVLRSGAEVGDLIGVTGELGKSHAGLRAIQSGVTDEGIIRSYTLPVARVDMGVKLAEVGVKSMIDISDGLGSEIRHICYAGGVGAAMYRDRIPISQEAKRVADMLNEDPLLYALSGGEDYELLFTFPPDIEDKITSIGDITVIGEIVDKDKGITMDGESVPQGFTHM